MNEQQAQDHPAVVDLDIDQRHGLQVGTFVRVVTPKGVVHQGEITATYGTRVKSADSIVVNGRSFATHPVSGHAIAIVDRKAGVIDPPRHEATSAEIHEAVSSAPKAAGVPRAVSLPDIERWILGFGPGYMGGRGKSQEGWANAFISVSKMKRTLEAMVDSGVLVRASNIPPSRDGRIVYLGQGQKTGWVTRADYDEAVAWRNATLTAKRHDDLLKEARGIVADRHPDEVEQVLAELVASK